MAPLQSVESARSRLYEIATRLTDDPDLREDLVSEMILFLLEQWNELKDKPDAYIFRACHRHAIDVLRSGKSVDSKRRSGVIVESLCTLCEQLGMDEYAFACSISGRDNPEKILTAQCLMRELLSRLTPVQREVLLTLLEGYRPTEIAIKRGVSKAAVSKCLRTIQRTFKEISRF